MQTSLWAFLFFFFFSESPFLSFFFFFPPQIPATVFSTRSLTSQDTATNTLSNRNWSVEWAVYPQTDRSWIPLTCLWKPSLHHLLEVSVVVACSASEVPAALSSQVSLSKKAVHSKFALVFLAPATSRKSFTSANVFASRDRTSDIWRIRTHFRSSLMCLELCFGTLVRILVLLSGKVRGMNARKMNFFWCKVTKSETDCFQIHLRGGEAFRGRKVGGKEMLRAQH